MAYASSGLSGVCVGCCIYGCGVVWLVCLPSVFGHVVWLVCLPFALGPVVCLMCLPSAGLCRLGAGMLGAHVPTIMGHFEIVLEPLKVIKTMNFNAFIYISVLY